MTDPRYPIYVPSKGRAEKCLTANMLVEDGVPFHLVVEEAEHDLYAERYGEDRILVLPFSDQGSVIPARNWIKDHATEAGHKRHWQFDDNIRRMMRLYRGKRLNTAAGMAIRVAEDFTDRYTNIAIAGFQYSMFVPESSKQKPFVLNCHVYSVSLILNEIPNRWRGTYNEDTDLCLQVLADGWCTVLLYAFLADKTFTMTMKGGNTDELYSAEDGRLKMARSLERAWPGVVETKRRFQRPQHVVADAWRKFDTPLIRDESVKVNPDVDEYGMKLVAKRDIKSDRIRGILKENNR